ncbi:MAG TPA: hypothetical protein VM285_15680 [Polyangia bacterium]|nr:hypothetical protein [Polyangia bacterium]
MLEIIVDSRRTIILRLAVADAVEEGEYEGLADDLRDCFTDNQIETIEELLESGDIEELIDEILSDWGGDDADALFDNIETFFADAGIELHFEDVDVDEPDAVVVDDDTFDDVPGDDDESEDDFEDGDEDDEEVEGDENLDEDDD